MAQTMSIQPIGWKKSEQYSDEWPTNWEESNIQREHTFGGDYGTNNRLAYLFRLPREDVSFTQFKAEVTLNTNEAGVAICTIVAGSDPAGTPLDSDSKSISSSTPTPFSFTLDSATISNQYCVIVLGANTTNNDKTYASLVSLELASISTPSQVFPVNTPTSGFIVAGNQQTFSVSVYNSTAYPPYTITAATLYWRAGTSGTFSAVAMTPSGDEASATLEAGTITEGTVQWYAEATDNDGRTTQTDLYTLTAVNGDVAATPLRPINVVENAESEIEFEWAYYSLDGTDQASADLQYSTDQTTWTALGPSVTGSAKNYTAPRGTLPGGTVWWRVKVTSAGGDESPWSSPVSLVVLGAPLVQAVQGDGKPFLTISWQVSAQVSYKVRIDGKVYGPYFGPEVREFTSALPLSGGMHTIAVAAQNQQSMWSAWEEAEASVATSAFPAINLYAFGSTNIILTWTGGQPIVGGYGYYLILRDGKVIAKTTNMPYVDRTVSGPHEYKCIQVLANGQYAQSNTATAAAAVNSPMIALLSGGDFLDLALSEDAQRKQTVTRSAQVVYTYLSGGRWPVAEIGETEDLTVTGDVAWMHEDEAAAAQFEAMLKKPVIYKTPGGACVVGVLQGYERNDPLFWKSYRFSVRQMEFEDYQDETS